MTKIKRVMLIDDEEIDQKQYARVIKRSGLIENLVVFSYADDALEFLKQSDDDFDLIFLDINMPRMNGFEFLQALVDLRGPPLNSAVVFMLTTSLNPDDRQRAFSFDVVKEFINKPLSVEDVQIAVSMVLNARADDGRGNTG